MKRAVVELANLNDEQLFKEVAEGISLIVKNAVSLDEVARLLFDAKKFRISSVIRGFAEEEAAKVLVLIDLIRCPRNRNERAQTAKRFYSHVTKRIYAKTCSYYLITTFQELVDFVEIESQTYYLDGPSGVDWVFVNSLINEREQNLYVDYVKSFGTEENEHYWSAPIELDTIVSEYETPECVNLSHYISKLGANSPSGLRTIGRIWRDFIPNPETDRQTLFELIDSTLKDLRLLNTTKANNELENFVKRHWSFPLWSVTIVEPRPQQDYPTELLKERRRIIEIFQRTEAKRNPPPDIAMEKVEELSKKYAMWRQDVDSLVRDAASKKSIHIRSGEDLEIDCQLPSFKRVQIMFEQLTEAERAALLALGWYAKEGAGADWPKIYERAKDTVSITSTNYQIHLGQHWSRGLMRWKEKPQPFTPGKTRMF